MKVKNARAAELSDFEVLQVLREMGKKQQLAILQNEENEKSLQQSSLKDVNLTKALTAKSIPTSTPSSEGLSIEERTMQSLPSNLRTIQYEVLEYLNNIQRPCAHQKSDQIIKFMDALYAWERGKPVNGVAGLNEGGEDGGLTTFVEREKRLTKGERLMLINHAPTMEIDLYPLVEEIEERFTSDQRQDILTIIAAHLPLDQEAIQAYQNRNSQASNSENVSQDMVVINEEEYDEETGLQDPDDDMDMLENEARGSLAVEDEGPDE